MNKKNSKQKQNALANAAAEAEEAAAKEVKKERETKSTCLYVCSIYPLVPE